MVQYTKICQYQRAMGQLLHACARTTAAVRRAIQHSQETEPKQARLAIRHQPRKRFSNGGSAPL